jgi:hypothetical protein
MKWTGYTANSAVQLPERSEETHVKPSWNVWPSGTTFEPGTYIEYKVEVFAIRLLYRVMSLYYDLV